jgi:hypothetical protein
MILHDFGKRMISGCYNYWKGTTSMNYKDRYTASDWNIWVRLEFDSDLRRESNKPCLVPAKQRLLLPPCGSNNRYMYVVIFVGAPPFSVKNTSWPTPLFFASPPPVINNEWSLEYIKNIVYTTEPRVNDVSPGINRCGRVKINMKLRP